MLGTEVAHKIGLTWLIGGWQQPITFPVTHCISRGLHECASCMGPLDAPNRLS